MLYGEVSVRNLSNIEQGAEMAWLSILIVVCIYD